MTDRYAVVGHPVAQSRSPFIHEQFAQQTGHDLVYERIDCPPDALAATIAQFFADGGQGLNVTAPHKQAAFALADRVGMRARIAGAVNTLSQSPERGLVGDNTDGTGLVRDLLVNLDWSLTDKRIVLLGAGGAARGVAPPLLGQSPALLTIANRTVERAVLLAENLAGFGPVEACGLDDIGDGHYDVIVNSTATGSGGEAFALDVSAENALCYDLVYGADDTPFMQWAQAHGAREAHDGWGMLVEQAAESFYIWHAVWPRTRPVIEARPF